VIGPLAALLLISTPSQAQTTTSTDAFARARVEFEAGVSALDKRQFDAAAAAFERSLALRESASALYNLAIARRKLGAISAAISSVKRFMEIEHPSSSTTSRLPEAKKMLAELEAQLARIELRASTEGARLFVDGAPIEAEAISVDPGVHVLEAQKEGHTADRRTVHCKPGERVVVTLAPIPIAVASSGITEKWWFWAAVAAAAVATGAVVVGVANADRPLPDGGSLGVVIKALQ
jgi:hypothetical protein